MRFEEWWPTISHSIVKVAAKAAWAHQEQRIKELERKLEVAERQRVLDRRDIKALLEDDDAV